MPIFKNFFVVEYKSLMEIIFARDCSSTSMPANAFLRYMPTSGHNQSENPSDKQECTRWHWISIIFQRNLKQHFQKYLVGGCKHLVRIPDQQLLVLIQTLYNKIISNIQLSEIYTKDTENLLFYAEYGNVGILYQYHTL